MRYPTKGGLCLPVEELGYDVVLPKRKATSNHHLYFNKARYAERDISRVFRSLVTNVCTMYIPEHNDLHDRYSEPVMPKDSLMIDVVDEYLCMNGVIDLVRESNTSQQYQLDTLRWEVIKARKA